MNIFISYRRQDSEWVTQSIYQELKKHFPDDSFFKDLDTIKPSEDYTKAIDKNLQNCEVMLVIIGKQWLDIKDAKGNQRLFNDNDFVRLEIARGLKSRKKIIPILVDNALMAEEDLLPENIKGLHKKQSVNINNVNFQLDVYNLAVAIKEATGTNDEYSDLIRDITSGKISNQELVKPNGNIAFAILCLLFGFGLLLFFYDNIPKVILSIALIFSGLIAIYFSNLIKTHWLKKRFADARSASKNTKYISIISMLSGSVLLALLAIIPNEQDPEIEKINIGVGTPINRKLIKTTPIKLYTKPKAKYHVKLLGKYPQASTRLLSDNDISQLSKYEMKLMRNEIFARKGYIFKDKTISLYFESQSWYQPQYENVGSLLSDVEKQNIQLINAYESY